MLRFDFLAVFVFHRSKILKWIDDGDVIGVFPYATGLPRLVLINRTKLDKWKRKRRNSERAVRALNLGKIEREIKRDSSSLDREEGT